jgi:hypothetical protein
MHSMLLLLLYSTWKRMRGLPAAWRVQIASQIASSSWSAEPGNKNSHKKHNPDKDTCKSSSFHRPGWRDGGAARAKQGQNCQDQLVLCQRPVLCAFFFFFLRVRHPAILLGHGPVLLP